MSYQKALFPEPLNLLGQRLQPLSIGHCMILERLENPLFVGGSDATEDHLFEAAYVCCQDATESWASFFAEGFAKKILKWRAKIGKHDFVNALKVFENYRDAGTMMPMTSGGGGETRRTLGTPFLLQIKIALQSRLYYSEKDALNKPVGAAVWEVIGLAEMNGDAKIFNEVELEIAKIHAEMALKEDE